MEEKSVFWSGTTSAAINPAAGNFYSTNIWLNGKVTAKKRIKGFVVRAEVNDVPGVLYMLQGVIVLTSNIAGFDPQDVSLALQPPFFDNVNGFVMPFDTAQNPRVDCDVTLQPGGMYTLSLRLNAPVGRAFVVTDQINISFLIDVDESF